MLLEHERNFGLGMDPERNYGLGIALGTRTESWFWHGCSDHRMLSEHQRSYDLGMDALVWAWMLWSPYALGT